MIDSLSNVNSYDIFPVLSSRKTAADSTVTAAKTGAEAADASETAKKNIVKEVKPVVKKEANAEVKNSEKQKEQTTVRFKLHKGTGATMIQIVDSNGKVIKEMPPEKILDSIAQIWKNAGINFDKSI